MLHCTAISFISRVQGASRQELIDSRGRRIADRLNPSRANAILSRVRRVRMSMSLIHPRVSASAVSTESTMVLSRQHTHTL